ncbi:MAG TPA: hypothetical protein VHG91_14965 [Longimicrobium sp.]|nr:hypothetical protein [Longimicrobium sp.]
MLDGFPRFRQRTCSEGRRNGPFGPGTATLQPRAPSAREAKIPASNPIDRALQTDKGRSRAVSAGILLLGLLIAAAILLSGDRRRERAASKIQLGDDTTAVVSALGPPAARCPPGQMTHLYDRFQGGTPRVARDAALARMRRETATRWIYPDDRGRNDCTPHDGDAEIGLDRDGRVVWLVPVTGRKTLVLPDTI